MPVRKSPKTTPKPKRRPRKLEKAVKTAKMLYGIKKHYQAKKDSFGFTVRKDRGGYIKEQKI